MKKYVLFFVIYFSLLLPSFIYSQDGNYHHYINEDGEVVFIQKLEWKKYEGIDHYRIELEEVDKSSKKATILDKNIEENSIELNLKSGTYRYRISIYNVLGKLEARSKWLEFEIFKATQPKILSIEPNKIEFYEDDEDKTFNVNITGENLLRNSKYRIIDSGGTTEGSVVTATGDTATVHFDFKGFKTGDYNLYVKNPGGLDGSFSIKISVLKPEEPEIAEEPEEVEITEEIEEPKETKTPLIEEKPEEPKETKTPLVEEKPEEPKETKIPLVEEKTKEPKETKTPLVEEKPEEPKETKTPLVEEKTKEPKETKTPLVEEKTKEPKETKTPLVEEKPEEPKEPKETKTPLVEEKFEEPEETKTPLVKEKPEEPKEPEETKTPLVEEKTKKPKKEKANFDFDLDIALGTTMIFQVLGKNYTDGKFYKEFFGKDFILPIFAGKISFLPVKTKYGNFGIGIYGDYSNIKVSKNRNFKSYELSGNMISAMGLFVYQKDLTNRFTLDLHTGTGISMLKGFKYNFSTPQGSYKSNTLDSSSLIIDGGFGIQFKIYKGFFAEIGSDFVYNTNLMIGNIEPKVFLGWKF